MLKPALSLVTEMYAGALHLPLACDSTKPCPRSEVTPAAAYALCRNTYAMPPLTPAAPACSCTFLPRRDMCNDLVGTEGLYGRRCDVTLGKAFSIARVAKQAMTHPRPTRLRTNTPTLLYSPLL